MRREAWRGIAAGLVASAACATAAFGADRIYDAEVRRLIASANREVGEFQRQARGALKKSIVDVDGVDLNLGDVLEDLQDVGRKLEKRYASEYAAVPDAVLFLERARRMDEFIAGHRGLSGADAAWGRARLNFLALSKAYSIDWAAEPAFWRPARSPDAPLRRAIGDFEQEARTFERALGAAAERAGIGESRRKGLAAEAGRAVGAITALRKTIEAERPTGQALGTAVAALARLEKLVREEGLADAAASSWRQLEGARKKVSGYLGMAGS